MKNYWLDKELNEVILNIKLFMDNKLELHKETNRKNNFNTNWERRWARSFVGTSIFEIWKEEFFKNNSQYYAYKNDIYMCIMLNDNGCGGYSEDCIGRGIKEIKIERKSPINYKILLDEITQAEKNMSDSLKLKIKDWSKIL